MQEFVAVIPSYKIINPDAPMANPLKKEALLFDKIAVANFASLRQKDLNEVVDPVLTQELFWLQEQGVVLDPEDLLRGREMKIEEVQPYETAYNIETRKIFEVLKARHKSKGTRAVSDELMPSMIKIFDLDARIISIRLRKLCNLDVYPLLLQDLLDVPTSNVERSAKKSDVLEIVLNEFPTPDDRTPWEEIFEFRNDSESQIKFARLREWMSDVSRMELSPVEMEEKIQVLMRDYRKHMEIHKMKITLSSIKTIIALGPGLISGGVATGLGVMPGLVGLVTTPYFVLKRRQINLMEEEHRAPGKEVAYIDAVRNIF